MVSVHNYVCYSYCILLTAMSSWQSCQAAEENQYVKLIIDKEGGYDKRFCDKDFALENTDLVDIPVKEASHGCYCQLLLADQGMLTIKDLPNNKPMTSYNAITEGSRQFTIGVSMKRQGYIYVKQGDHLEDLHYNFPTGIRLFTYEHFEWLNCTAASQMQITNLANPHTTSTTTTTTTDLPLKPTTSTTQTSLPVSEKPRESQKGLIIEVIIGVALLMVIVAVLVFLMCCIVRKRRLKAPKEVSKAPYIAVSANDGDITLTGPIYQNSAAASVNNSHTHDQSVDKVEYAEIKPDSLVPRTNPNGQDQAPPSGEASKPLVYADLAFHASPTTAGNGEKVEAAAEKGGPGMTEDQLNQLYAKPVKRKK